MPAPDEDPVKFEQERQARRHFAKGLVPTFEKAELVVQLTTLYYEEEEAVKAALACDSLEKAEAFLTAIDISACRVAQWAASHSELIAKARE